MIISSNYCIGSLTFNTDDRLNDTANENIEYTRFFKCDSDQTLHFNENKTKVFPTVLVSELRVQAFDFNNKTSGAFDNGMTNPRVALCMNIMVTMFTD